MSQNSASFLTGAPGAPDRVGGPCTGDGLEPLLRPLLDASLAEARRFACTHVHLEVDAQGALSVLDAGRAVPARALLDVLAARAPAERGPAVLWGSVRRALAALGGRARVDAWEAGHHWRAAPRTGRAAWAAGDWAVEELHPAEPCPEGASCGTRLWCLPSGTVRADAEVLARQGRTLAFLAPGLEVRGGTCGGGGSTFHYPRGLAQRVEELTASLPRLHPEPFAFDVRWDGVRARFALQWSEAAGGQVLAYANTRPVPRQSLPVVACLAAVRSALATLTGLPLQAFTAARMKRGLTAIFAVDGPPHVIPAHDEDLTPAAARAVAANIAAGLYPLALEAFAAHPVTPHLVARARV